MTFYCLCCLSMNAYEFSTYTHSMATLLGTRLLMQICNRSVIKACIHGQDYLLQLILTLRKKGDLTDVGCGMFVGLSISETADLL